MSELIICGERPTKNFTILPNQVLNTLPISSTAKIIIAHFLSKPKGWQTNLESIYKNCCDYDSKNAVKKAVGVLQKLGFLTLKTLRTGKQFSGCNWFLNLDHILTYPPSRSAYKIAMDENANTSLDNKTDPIKTDLNKTNSAPESPPPEPSKPISLDLEQSFSKPETTNRIQARIAALMHQSTSSANQERIKQREHEEARFAQLQRHNQMLDASQHLGITAPYAGLSPAQTVAQLCKEYIANPRPRLDEKSRKKLTDWLEKGGQLVRLIDCFKQAHQNQSKTAKYVVKILAT